MLRFFKNLFAIKPRHTDVLLKFELDDGKMYQEKIELDKFEERVSSLQKQFHQPKALSELSFIFCLVGNIIDSHHVSIQDKVSKGTKHFSPGTKVFCYPPRWGDGYEKIKVIGRHRKSSKLITIILASKYVTNWRMTTVYNPFVIREMLQNSGWTDNESDRVRISEMLTTLKNR